MNAHAHYYLFPIHPYLSPRSGRFRVIVRVTDAKKASPIGETFSLCVGITYLPGKSPCKYCRRR